MTDMEQRSKEGAVKIKAEVDSVTVLEDRAQVVRRAVVELTAGRQLLLIDGVTPLAADQTLRCRVKSAGDEGDVAPRVLDLRLERRYVVRARRPEEEQELTRQMEELVEQYLACHDEVQPLHHQRGLLRQAVEGVSQQLSEQLFLGRFDAAAAGDIHAVFARWDALEEELVALYWQQEERERRIDRLEDRRERALSPLTEYRAELLSELQIPEAGSYQLEWEYLVPCAIWRPEYKAELEQGEAGGAQVHWRSGGTVWQSTGEDWEGVKLSLSTARPSLGAELPLLAEDRLRPRQKSDQEKSVIQVESRDEEISTTAEQPPERVATPPGLEDGGEARTFEVPGRVNLPADGLPHRLEFESWSADATTEMICLAERAAFAFTRSTQRNGSKRPLLAGPVALSRGGGYVGQSEVRFVAPSEQFALSWGSEDGVAVSRRVERRFNDAGLISKKRFEFEVEVFLSNNTGADLHLRLVERLPVSELEQVKVQVDKSTSPGFSKDDQGQLSWNVDLVQGATRKYTLAFNVTMPSNVHWNG